MVAPYQTTLAGFESTGGRRMYNALGSGATGKYQFMPETWADLMRRFPNAGLTPAGITDNSEGGQQDIALQLFNASNNRVLKQSLGRDPLAWETYAAHRFGAGGAQDLFGASDDTPVRLLFPPKWIEQNPDIADKTAGEVKTLFQGRFGQSPPVEVSAREPAQPVQETPAMAAPQMPATPPVPGLLYDPASAAPAQDAGKDTSGWGGLLGEGGWQSALVAGLMSLGDGLRGGSGGAGLQMLMAAQQAQQQRKDRAEDRQYKNAALQIQLMNALRKQNGVHVVGKHLVDDAGKVIFTPQEDHNALFTGNSVEGQAINKMVEAGLITKEQGMNWVAGKPLVGQNGSVTFVTPAAVYGTPGAGPASGGVPPSATQGSAANPPPLVPGLQPLIAAQPKDVPANMTSAMLENVNAVRKIDSALVAMQGGKTGTGFLQGIGNAVLPGDTLNWLDPGGRNIRALISDIGSLKIHDRSGAAVTASEFPRLRPFVPTVSDTPETVQEKLNNFRTEYLNILRDQSNTYGPDNGYKGNMVVRDFLERTDTTPATSPQYSQDDLEYTAKKHGITVDEVKRRLGVQ